MPSPYDALLSAAPEPAQAASPSPYDALLTAAAPRQSSQYDQLLAAVKPPSSTPATDAASFGDSGPSPAEGVAMEQQFKAAHPWLYGAVKGAAGMIPIPTSIEQAKQMIKPPIQGAAGEEGVQAQQQQLVQEANAWGQAITGQLGPEAQGEAVVGTALQAAPLLHLPFAKSPFAKAGIGRGVEPSVPSQRPGVSGEAATGAAELGGGPVPPSGVQGIQGPPEVPVTPEVAAEAAQVQGTPEAAATQGKTLSELAAEGAGGDLTESLAKAQRRSAAQAEVERLTNLIRGVRAFGTEAEKGQISAMEARIAELNDQILGKTETAAEPTGVATVVPAVTLTERALPEGDIGGTVGVEIKTPEGIPIGDIGGKVTPEGFTVNVATIDRPFRGKGNYQAAIQQLADKYGTVRSSKDLAPAAEAAWKKVGAIQEENGSYVLKGGEQYASSQPSAARVRVPPVREGVGQETSLRQPGETAPVQGDVGGGAAEPKAQAEDVARAKYILEHNPIRDEDVPAYSGQEPFGKGGHGYSQATWSEAWRQADKVWIRGKLLKSGAGDASTFETVFRGKPSDFAPAGTKIKPPPPAEPAPQEAPVRVTDTDPHVSAIANRFVAERAAAGQIGEIAPGQGFATTDLTARGLRMPPEEVNQHISDVMQNRGGNPIDQAAAIRGEEARLSQRSNQLSRASEANPRDLNARIAADNAFKDLTDFHNGPVAKLKNNWHAQGMAMQGEIPVDLSTIHGLKEAWLKDTGKAPPASIEPTLRKMADRVKRTTAEENGAMQRLGQEIEKATARKKLPTADEVAAKIREKMGLGPCKL